MKREADMRLAICALSAVLLSGCSWLGQGGQSSGFGQTGGAYGVNCAPGGAYGGAGYGYGYGADAGCGFGGGYDVSGAGFGACLLYTSPSPRDKRQSRMPSSA